MRRTKEQKGITLIALIITIVVLLILAVVAINSIQNDGIMSHAGNTANTYNQAVLNEQQHLDNYLSYLDKVQGELNGGSTSNPEEGSGNDGSTEGTSYTTYTLGQEVTVVVDGVEHAFYVIEENDNATKDKIILLAKANVDTETLIQDGENNYVAFSTDVYWEIEWGEYSNIEETLPIPDSHTVAKAAYDYGVKVGGKGRLMIYTEAENLSKTNFSTKLYETQFWMESNDGISENTVLCVWGCDSWYPCQFNHVDENTGFGVRPVVEISKSKLS